MQISLEEHNHIKTFDAHTGLVYFKPKLGHACGLPYRRHCKKKGGMSTKVDAKETWLTCMVHALICTEIGGIKYGAMLGNCVIRFFYLFVLLVLFHCHTLQFFSDPLFFLVMPMFLIWFCLHARIRGRCPISARRCLARLYSFLTKRPVGPMPKIVQSVAHCGLFPTILLLITIVPIIWPSLRLILVSCLVETYILILFATGYDNL